MGIWNLIFGKILNPFSYTTFPPTNDNVTEENQPSSANINRKSRKRRKRHESNSHQNSQQSLRISNEGENFIENGNGHPLHSNSNPEDPMKQTGESSVLPHFQVSVPGPSSSSTQQQSGNCESPQNSKTRGVKRRRYKIYSQDERERAVRLLNQGIPCRKVAEMIDPGMSSGTPIRWRKRMRATVEAQHRLNESLANNNN